MHDIFGGSIYEYADRRGDRIPTITWSCTSRDAQKCAERLLPYLLLKNEQAILLIRFYNLLEKRKKNYRMSKAVDDERAKLFDEMRKHNVKGRLRLKRLNEETPKGDAIV